MKRWGDKVDAGIAALLAFLGVLLYSARLTRTTSNTIMSRFTNTAKRATNLRVECSWQSIYLNNIVLTKNIGNFWKTLKAVVMLLPNLASSSQAVSCHQPSSTSTSFELESSTARVISIKSTKQESVSELSSY